MSDAVEFRVRPVTRFVLTRFEQHEKGSESSVVGEFDNVDRLYDVARAMTAVTPNAKFFAADGVEVDLTEHSESWTHIITGINVFEPENIVYFAYSEANAQKVLAEAQKNHPDTNFAILRVQRISQ